MECESSLDKHDEIPAQYKRIGSSRESRASRISGSVNSTNKPGK